MPQLNILPGNASQDMAAHMETNTQNHWQTIDRAYISYLRIHTSIYFFLIFIAVLFSAYILEVKEQFLAYSIALILLIGAAVALIAFWAPAKYRRSRYRLDESALYFESGYIFWRSAAIPFNRIQHVEVRQGPIESRLSLSHLKLYTAGSLGSDLTVPGLLVDEAHKLKDLLLAKHEILNEQTPVTHDR